ncbi:MAG: thiamine pyrophosphate-dependent dehydrogenase E1 component subunit alpha [Thermoplasmatales archaeon]|jgi:Pyruvate/2-oxoglutarate dehydrogenase complex, dehydrogenase (E1) component, eukaryotic type, alpha subunit
MGSNGGGTLKFLNRFDENELLNAYRVAVYSRTLDNRIINAQRQGIIGFHTPSAGHEIPQVAMGMLLEKDDIVINYYRDLTLLLFRGVPVENLLDHFLANSEDFSHGRNMPDHYNFREYGFYSVQSPVAMHLPFAVGAAYAKVIKKENGIVLSNTGDGGTSTGDFHAALNFASVWKMPIMFVIENNGYAISLPTSEQTKAPIEKKGEAYGIPGISFDGNDIFSALEGFIKAFEYVRTQRSPILVEARIYRMGPHSTSDDPKKYRKDEIVPGSSDDPLVKFKEKLKSLGILNEEFDNEIKKWATEDIERKLEERMKIPPPSKETIIYDVYENPTWIQEEERREWL